MKSILIIVSLLFFCNFSAQRKMKDYKNIMYSKNIYEIDAFLKDAHPNDARREVLKPRLMQLIRDYMKTAHPADQRLKEMQEKLALLKKRPNTKIGFEEMNAIIKQKQIAKYKAELAAAQQPQQSTSQGNSMASGAAVASYAANSFSNKDEEDEFKMLMNLSPTEHKQKTVNLLNQLFDNDPTNKEAIVLITNKTDCNIIVRIEGANNLIYRLPVPANSENSIVVQKGDYIFSSLVCNSQYASQKTINKPLQVSLELPKK